MEKLLEPKTSCTQLEVSDGSNPSTLNHIAQVKKLLRYRMLVGVNDGRFFLGTFYCMDKQGNILLSTRSKRRAPASPMEQRGLGLVLIPFSCRTSCHVDCSIEEQLSALSLQEPKQYLC